MLDTLQMRISGIAEGTRFVYVNCNVSVLSVLLRTRREEHSTRCYTNIAAVIRYAWHCSANDETLKQTLET